LLLLREDSTGVGKSFLSGLKRFFSEIEYRT